MPLEEYKRKRNFARTPEPSGDASGKPSRAKNRELFFCVQKHLASHLHYDFRLEWNGVLLSWAVPKGPSLNPAEKRLAMQTEDHPYDYGTFEGVIPEGYGAGIVMLWDQGTWTPQVDDVDAALKKGDLKFTLNGFKLKGSWVLVRTSGRYRGASGSSDRSWLLIKHRDEWAGPIDITTFAPHSVKTPDADLADILAADQPDIWHSNAPAKGGDSGAMFQKIIQRALEIRDEQKRAKNTPTSANRPAGARTSAKKSADKQGAKAKKGTPGSPKLAQSRAGQGGIKKRTRRRRSAG